MQSYDGGGLPGVGPLGLSCILSAATEMEKGAKIFAVDLAPARLKKAKELGATHLINNQKGDCVEQIMKATNGKGVDFIVECVGLPIGWHICQDLVAMGGQIAILGVHGAPGTIALQKLWAPNVSIHTGMVHGYTIQELRLMRCSLIFRRTLFLLQLCVLNIAISLMKVRERF